MDKINPVADTSTLPLKDSFKPALWSKIALSLGVGPAMLLVTLFFAVNYAPYFAQSLATAAVLGLFFAGQGSSKSLFFSLSLPFLAFGWQLSNELYFSGHSSEYLLRESLWQLGLSFATATSLFTTASGFKLSFKDAENLEKEQEHLVKIAKIEAYNDRLKLIELQNLFESLKNEYAVALELAKADANERELVLHQRQEIIDIARSEILSQHHLIEKTNSDYCKVKLELAKSEDALDLLKEELTALKELAPKVVEKIEYRQVDLTPYIEREKALEKALEEKERQTHLVLSQLEKTHEEWKKERDGLLLEIEAYQNLPPQETVQDTPIEESTQYRRLNGFYTQLKQQFEEKSKTLDEARKELFALQEELAKKEIEQKESGHNKEIQELTNWIAKIEQESEKRETTLKNEIEALEEIIANLSAKKSRKK